jgi:valyl-tRNA synthetase
MRPLADKALAAWERGEVRFYPRKWENTYTHWLRNIRDWCISRQLWWGHRIPVWYCDACGKMTVAREDPAACAHCGGSKIRQDPDVLDTWFSSALWPFSTLGWPDDTHDLRNFYPTTVLVTAYEILFFWVARMIMMGLEFRGEVPFRDVLIHGLVRDMQGRKMSKSLGNGIDPLEIVAEYGADALKFTLAFLAAQGQDILMNKESFKLGSKFANKIWNASRYLLMNLEAHELVPASRLALDEVDRWVFDRLNAAVRTVREALDQYRFFDAAQAAYEFFWNDFCDWYLEASKLKLDDRKLTLLLAVLEESLRLLHPLLPFLTEEIYQKLPGHQASIMSAPYPEIRPEREHPEAVESFALVQELVRAVRTVRAEFTIPFDRPLRVAVAAAAGPREVLRDHLELVSLLTNARELAIGAQGDSPVLRQADRKGGIPVVGSGFEAFVHIRELIDVARETARLSKELAGLESLTERTRLKLDNPAFVQKAPAEVVAKERAKLEEFARRREKIQGYLQDLQP